VREQLRAQNTELPPENVLRQQVLDRVILDQLQLQLAVSNNIQVDDETLTSNLRNIAQQNNMSLEQFRATLEGEGHDFNAFREEIRNQITIARLHQQMVGSRINVTEQEIDTLLANEKTWGGAEKEYHLGHILIPVPDGASPEQNRAAQKQAEDTVAALRGGADFAKTAVAVSAGQTALQGGDLGWRKAGQLPTVMAEVVNNIQAGEIADPVRAAGGFHIVKLLEVRGVPGNSVDRDRHEGFREVLGKSGKNFEIVEVVGMWDDGTAQKATADAIAIHKSFDGAYTQGGSTGMVRAFMDAGHPFIPMSNEGENGARKLCAEHSADGLKCSSAGQTPALVAIAIKAALAALQGEVVPQMVSVPIPYVEDPNFKDGENFYSDQTDNFFVANAFPACGVSFSAKDIMTQTEADQ